VEWFTLQVKDIMELLEVCLRSTYFQAGDKLFHQKNIMAMGSSLSLVIIIFMKHYEKVVFDIVQHKMYLWLWYVNDTFMAWLYGPERLQNFFNYFNTL
jgi:hypothetical protein